MRFKNHKGLSYVEVMIVLGIGAILTSLAFVSLGFINRNNVTKSASKLQNAISHSQNLSMTKGKEKGCITITQENNTYYYYFGTSSSSVKYKFAQNPCEVVGFDKDGNEVAIGSTGLRYYFVSNTGAVNISDSATYNGCECYKIILRNKSGTNISLVIHSLTGKVTME